MSGVRTHEKTYISTFVARVTPGTSASFSTLPLILPLAPPAHPATVAHHGRFIHKKPVLNNGHALRIRNGYMWLEGHALEVDNRARDGTQRI